MRPLLDMVWAAPPSLCLDVWVVASIPRQQTSVLILSARSRRTFQRTILATLPSLQVPRLPLRLQGCFIELSCTAEVFGALICLLIAYSVLPDLHVEQLAHFALSASNAGMGL